jgi:hypothetical protein
MRAPIPWLSLVLMLGACISARQTIPAEPARPARRPDSASADRRRQAEADTFLLRLADVDRATRARDIARWVRPKDSDPARRAVRVRVEGLAAGQQSRTQPGPIEWSLSAALQE